MECHSDLGQGQESPVGLAWLLEASPTVSVLFTNMRVQNGDGININGNIQLH